MFKLEPYIPTAGSLLKWMFSLIVALAGLFYLFNSKSAEKLETVEGTQTNRSRRRYRRIGGAFMLLLAIGIYVGLSIDADLHPRFFVIIWLAVLFFLATIVSLALVDVRMTWKIRRRR